MPASGTKSSHRPRREAQAATAMDIVPSSTHIAKARARGKYETRTIHARRTLQPTLVNDSAVTERRSDRSRRQHEQKLAEPAKGADQVNYLTGALQFLPVHGRDGTHTAQTESLPDLAVQGLQQELAKVLQAKAGRWRSHRVKVTKHALKIAERQQSRRNSDQVQSLSLDALSM